MTADPPGREERERVLGKTIVVWRRRDASNPGRPVVVVLHGAGGSHRSHDELVAALGGFDVVAPALPGRSGSEGAAPESAADAAAIVIALLASIGAERVIVVGHSYGGAIAIEIALVAARENAPAIAGVVLVATGARLRVHPSILERASAAARGEAPPFDLAPLFRSGNEALAARVAARLATVPPAAALADWTAANRFDRLKDLGAVRAPLVAMAGEDDALTPPRYAHYLAAHVPGARAAIVPGAGHMLPMEMPEHVAAIVRDLVDSAQR